MRRIAKWGGLFLLVSLAIYGVVSFGSFIFGNEDKDPMINDAIYGSWQAKVHCQELVETLIENEQLGILEYVIMDTNGEEDPSRWSHYGLAFQSSDTVITAHHVISATPELKTGWAREKVYRFYPLNPEILGFRYLNLTRELYKQEGISLTLEETENDLDIVYFSAPNSTVPEIELIRDEYFVASHILPNVLPSCSFRLSPVEERSISPVRVVYSTTFVATESDELVEAVVIGWYVRDLLSSVSLRECVYLPSSRSRSIWAWFFRIPIFCSKCG